MKPTELRIGNYYIPTDDSLDEYKQVTPDDLKAWSMGACYGKEIPLTEDWLKRAGADERNVMGETWNRWFINGHEPPEWIKYVHELQNWYYWKFAKTELKFLHQPGKN